MQKHVMSKALRVGGRSRLFSHEKVNSHFNYTSTCPHHYVQTMKTTSRRFYASNIKVKTMIKEFPKLSNQVKPVTVEEFSRSLEKVVQAAVNLEKKTSRTAESTFTSEIRIALAISGGSDSMALALLTKKWHDMLPKEAKMKISLFAITLDHGKREESKDEVRLVHNWLTTRCGIPTIIGTVEWQPDEKINQKSCRDKRLELFHSICSQEGASILLMGHHQIDQIELFLYRLSMCSGILGLCGQPLVNSSDGLYFGRPLIDIPKERLIATCIQSKQHWVEDPTNTEDHEFRGYIRSVLPQWAHYNIDLASIIHQMNTLTIIRDQQNLQIVEFLNNNLKLNLQLGYVAINLHVLINELSESSAHQVMVAASNFVNNHWRSPRLSSLQHAYKSLKAMVTGEKPAAQFNMSNTIFIPYETTLYISKSPKAQQSGIQFFSYDEPILYDGRFKIEVSRFNKYAPPVTTSQNVSTSQLVSYAPGLGREYELKYAKYTSSLEEPTSNAPLIVKQFKQLDSSFKISRPIATLIREKGIPHFINAQLPVILDSKGVLAIPFLNYKREAVYWTCEYIPSRDFFEPFFASENIRDKVWL